MITNKIEALEEVMRIFERVEKIKQVILFGDKGHIKRIILAEDG